MARPAMASAPSILPTPGPSPGMRTAERSVHVLPPSSVAMTPLALVLAPFEVQPTHPCDGSGNATATAMPTPEGQGSGGAVHVRPPSAVDSSSATIGPTTGPGARA